LGLKMESEDRVKRMREKNEKNGIKRFEVKYLASYPDHKKKIKKYADNLIRKFK
jgi:hypothetical protein